MYAYFRHDMSCSSWIVLLFLYCVIGRDVLNGSFLEQDIPA